MTDTTTENHEPGQPTAVHAERPVGRQGPERAKLTKRQNRMQKAIAYMQQYMAEYHKQAACLDYSDATFIDDVLYGLGVALNGTSCSYAGGYEAWKDKLREHLTLALSRAARRKRSAPAYEASALEQRVRAPCPKRGNDERTTRGI